MRLEGLVNAADAAMHAPMGVVGDALATVGDDVARRTTGAMAGADGGLPAAVTSTDAHAGAAALQGRIRSLVDQPAGQLTTHEWDEFADALAADPLGTSLIGPRQLFDAPDLKLVVDGLRMGDETSLEHANRYFAAWRAAAQGPEALRDGVLAQLRRMPDDLTPDEWKQLRGLVDADPTGEVTKVPPMAERQYAGLRQTIKDLGGHGPRGAGEQNDIQFRRWVRANDPEYPARLKDAVDAAIAQRWTADQFWTLRVEADGFEDLVKTLPDLTPAERRQVAFVVSGTNHQATAGWMQRHDPEYPTFLQAAVDAVLEGTELNKLHHYIIKTAKDDLDTLVAGRPFEEQRTIASKVLYGTELADWNRANDPTWTAQVEAKLDAYLAGDTGYELWGPLSDEGDNLLPLLEKRPFEQQRQYWSRRLNAERYVEWVRANDPDLGGTVRAALDEALAGKVDDRTRLLLEAEAGRLDEFIAGKPYEEQDRIARAMLHRNDYYEWDLAHDPANRVKVDAAVQRVIDGKPREEGDGIIFVQEKDRIDQLVAGHPYDVQERIAREVLGQQSLYFSEWLARNDPNYDATLNAIADAAIAGTTQRGDTGVLYWLREDLPKHVFAGRSVEDNLKIIAEVNKSGTASSWVPGWRAALEPELSDLQRRAAADAATGELGDDAIRVLRAGGRERLDELTAGADYETRLRIADVVLDSQAFQQWKVANDTDRVARVTASAHRLADGTATPHDARVLRGESKVLGLVKDRPYAEQLRVAELALDGGGLTMWTRANDPEYAIQLGAAIDDVAAGTATPEQLTLIEMDRANTFRLLADRDPEAQGAIAIALLGAHGSSYEGPLAAMRELALDARTRLTALPDVEATKALRQSTLEMLDLNVQRMTGLNVNDPNRGYSVHPDYAEMGRVQANLELLEAVAKGRTSQASADELLSW